MDSRGLDKMDDLPVADTPEDVAVLYSWANLHGAKYRDFSASRREYRAQLRHRAAEQIREQELKAQADAEAAAAAADAAARQAESAAHSLQNHPADSSREHALREAGRASRIASAERVEAARRAEAAALAEAVARREEREIAEANASARRQAARYAESEIRSRESGVHRVAQVPGQISDPYTQPVHPQPQPQFQALPQQHFDRINEAPAPVLAAPAPPPPPAREYNPSPAPPAPVYTPPPAPAPVYTAPPPPPAPPVVFQSSSQRRPQGYRPDDASGVRQIYRGPEFDAPQGEYVSIEPVRPVAPIRNVPPEPRQPDPWANPVNQTPYTQRATPASFNDQFLSSGHRDTAARPVTPRPSYSEPPMSQEAQPQDLWPGPSPENFDPAPSPRIPSRRAAPPPQMSNLPAQRGPDPSRNTTYQAQAPRVPASEPLQDASRGRRAQDDYEQMAPPPQAEAPRRGSSSGNRQQAPSAQRPGHTSDPTGPAWLYAPQTPQAPAPQQVRPPSGQISTVNQSSVADTLQYSRERVAARWYALKGVFEQPGQDQQEAPVRQKEVRTPVLAVFSLAGGVGKTSLVATLGRALSSLGEKVLLTDTTSHGLLPFYFGASELRQGVVRTFSPPSGSTDAPIYLVSYDVDQRGHEEELQAQLVDEITQNSKGTHRILLDLTPSSSWIARRMARMNPTILVPVAPDMNSVISLQAVEKYFHGAIDADGRPLQPYYLLNQFDASLPLHLDVREVLRRQLGDRLLPFVIRRSPSVSEALAEGMTVVDYAPETPVAEDYQNVATWLRSIAAPATAGFRNVRWSER